VLRDIPSKFIVGGLRDSLRDVVKERMKQLATECRCIRCREYGHRAQGGWEIGEPRMVRMDYQASGGKEIFLSFEDEKETLFGLLRMRIQTEVINRLGLETFQNEATDNLSPPTSMEKALIRELHIYGPEVPLKQQNPLQAQHGGLEKALVREAQHKGLGKALLSEAERIAREEFQAQQMVVLSGTGAKEYYRSECGYSSQADYMVKSL